MARRTKAKNSVVAQLHDTAPDFSFEEHNVVELNAGIKDVNVDKSESITSLNSQDLSEQAATSIEDSIDAISGMFDESFDAEFSQNLTLEDKNFDDSLIDLDFLAEQIALATEELSVEDAGSSDNRLDRNVQNDKPAITERHAIFKNNESKNKEVVKSKRLSFKNPAVDESIAEQLFGQKPIQDGDTTNSGGTVSTPLLTKKPRPDNDDATHVSTRRKLSQKPSFRIYWSTTALSALWALGGAFIASKLMPSSIGSIANFALTPTGMAIAAGTAIPIFMFWGFAQLSKRSRELQNIADLVSDAALRLSTTENNSEEQLATLGQTVRNEVAAMSEGIERTLSRAVELEALIQGEVNNLERAYAENETRIHTLINELSNEREAILSHADRVQSTLRGTQIQLSSEFGSITSNIAANVQNVAQTLSQTLQLQGEDLIGRLSQVSDGVGESLAEKFSQTAQNIQSQNKELYIEMEERFNNAAERFDLNGRAIIDTLKQGSAETEERAAEVALRMQEVTETALSNFDEKFKILDQALLQRSSESLDQFSVKLSRLDDKSLQLTSSFDNATSAAIEAFERRLAEVDTSLGERSTSIMHSFIARAQTLEENTEKLGHFLDAHTSKIEDTLKERTIDIANTFKASRNEIIQAMDQGKTSFAEDVNSINIAISDVIKERTEDFTTQLSYGREVISDMLEEKNDKLIETVHSQMQFLSKHVDDIETLLVKNVSVFDEHAREHVVNIDQRTLALRDSIEKSFDTAREVLDAQAENIDTRADALRDSLTVNSAALNEVLGDQARIIEERIDHIRNILNQGDYNFTNTLAQQITLVENAINTNNTSLRDTFSAHLNGISSHTLELKTVLDDTKGVLFETLNDRIEDFNESLKTKSLEISERATILEENLSRTLNDVNYNLENQANVLTDRTHELQYVIEKNNELIKEKFVEQTSSLDEHTQIMQNTLSRSVENVKDAIESSTISLSGNLIDNLVAVQETLSEEAQKAGTVILNARNELITGLSDETEKTASLLSDTGTKVITSLGEEASKMRNSINTLGDNLASAFSDITTKAQSVLSSSGERIAETISAESSYFEQSIISAGDQISSSLHAQIDNASTMFAQAGNNFQSAFSEELVRAEQLMSEQNARFSETFNNSATNVEQSLANRSLFLSEAILQFQNNLEGQLEGISKNLTTVSLTTSERINEQIENLGSISKNLSHAAQQAGNSFGKISGHLGEQINNATHEAELRIREQNEALINAFAQRSSETVQAVSSVKDNLIENVSALLNKIDTSTDSIHNNTQQMFGTLQEIDNNLSETAKLFEQNTLNVSNTILSSNESLNSNVQVLQGVYNTAFEQMNFIAQNFDAHANLLNQAVSALDMSQDSFNSNIEQNQNALLHLTQEITNKSSDVAKIIEHYENLINSSFSRTDQNAKKATVQLQNDLEKMIKNALTSFSQAAFEIQRSSNEIKSELEKSNSELNVSMRLLPTQTKEATNVIRHAVADQLKALQDISKTIDRNSKNFATTANAYASVVQKQPIADTSVSHSQPSNAQSYMRENKAPLYAERANQQKDGWVSSLLARASRDEGSVATLTKPEKTRAIDKNTDSLNSLSSDIVRAIDDRAINELWSNYRRDRRNINPQTLYTANGQLIFDKLKQKCRFDSDFGRSVNQYIADYEKLLREMNQKGASKDAVRQYLTSDTGKVYTMLAHVNGRIQ